MTGSRASVLPNALSDSTPNAAGLYVGLMSGTSLDGVDAVLAAFDPNGIPSQVLGHLHEPFPGELRTSLLALNASGPDELHRAALAANELACLYATATTALLARCGTPPESIIALGAHGQTVRHRPGEFDGHGYTLQLLNGALLSELSGIDVVCDFRSRDVAAGGQGAPLVPAFHQALFGRTDASRAVLNIGGMANITALPVRGPVSGFDSGPGNVLMDLWCERHLGEPFDRGGAWAARGRVIPALLEAMLDDEFVQRVPPKSTGRDHFNSRWLEQKLRASANEPHAVPPQDVQATLAQFTVDSAVSALKAVLPDITELLVCGGGALNGHLMQRLSDALPTSRVHSTAIVQIDPMQVEAFAFAWLARAFMNREAGNIPAVTGAKGVRPLGAWHPARHRA